MTTPEQITLEKEALTKFSQTVNTILLYLRTADQNMADAKAIKIANLPPGGDESIRSVTNVYSGRADELHGNLEAARTALKHMASSADQILKLYNTAGHNEEISVDAVKNIFNAVLGGQPAQQQPSSVPPGSVPPSSVPPAGT